MKEQVYRAVGKKLKALRHAYGLTLQEVCAHLSREGIELSEATLNRVENARTMLRLDVARKVFRLLGTPLDDVDEIIAEAESRQVIDATGYSFDELMKQGSTSGAYGDYHTATALFRAAVDQARRELGPLSRKGVGRGGAGRSQINRLTRAVFHLADCHRRLHNFRLNLDLLARVLDLPGATAEHRLLAVLGHASTYRALDSFYRARLYAEDGAKGLDRATPETRAYGAAVIGNVLLEQGSPAKALPHYRSALKFHIAHGMESQAIQCQSLIALAHYRQGRPEVARRLLEASYQAAQDNDRYAKPAAFALRQLGIIAYESGSFDEARERFKEAESINRRLRLANDLFGSLHLLWKVELAAGQKRAARRYERVLRGMLPQIDPFSSEAQEFRATTMRARGRATTWQ